MPPFYKGRLFRGRSAVEIEASARDAERNRQRLLEAAKDVLARDGASASLEEIARTAGVGIGTLYRHFPKRDDLIEAVYHQAVSQLGEAAEQLSETHAPADALREWLLLFIDYMSTKRLMAEALNSLDGGASRVYAGSGDIMRQALNGLVQRAEAAGEIRAVADPFENGCSCSLVTCRPSA